jgi:hypothetical protein
MTAAANVWMLAKSGEMGGLVRFLIYTVALSAYLIFIMATFASYSTVHMHPDSPQLLANNPGTGMYSRFLTLSQHNRDGLIKIVSEEI